MIIYWVILGYFPGIHFYSSLVDNWAITMTTEQIPTAEEDLEMKLKGWKLLKVDLELNFLFFFWSFSLRWEHYFIILLYLMFKSDEI